MSDIVKLEYRFSNYLLQQSRHDTAVANSEKTSVAREVAARNMRLAEILSQSEPLHRLATKYLQEAGDLGDLDRLRAMMYAAAFYVNVGRMPKEIS